VELEQNSSSSSTSLSRTTATAWHINIIGKHAWLAGQATIASTQKQGGGEETHRSAHRGARQKTMAETRRRSHGCGSKATVLRLRWRGGRHRAHDRAAEHSMAATSGLQTTIQPMRRQGGHHKHRGARAGAPARLTEVDQAVGARSTGRSSTAMAAIGGKDDETPRSGGSTRRGGADTP
jgi:hypothetical protein